MNGCTMTVRVGEFWIVASEMFVSARRGIIGGRAFWVNLIGGRAISDSQEILMSTKLSSSDHAWKASELRRLPPSERDDILAKAAAIAEPDYRSKPQWTDFEA